ncbi:MAG: PAS domain S-box protein [Crocinitomicaceae bacterium]|nr:PAS domain S-box protein [Crocinitomicaceae bacterium]
MKVDLAKFSGHQVYRILFASINEGVIIVNKDGAILLANPRSHELFGYDEGTLENVTIEQLVPEASREKHVKLRTNFHASPRKRSMGEGMNLQAVRKDGSKFYVEISLNHFSIEDEIFVAALITDITQRVEQENQIKELNSELERKVLERTQEVRESQELYSAIARNFPNGTINVFDRNLNYIFVEGKELFQLGITSEKLIGTPYLMRLSPEIRPKIQSALMDVFSGEGTDFEIEYKDQFYRLTAVPLSKKNNKIDKILVVEQNITQQHLASQQLEEALQKERSLNEMKSRFVSMASHEFRTPLSTILSSVSLIEKYIENGAFENTPKHIKRIKNSVKGLTDILNDFLSVDKLENEKTEIKISCFDYHHFSKEMVEDMQGMCREGQVIDRIVKGAHTELWCDINILRNILYNLLTNAIKYSGEDQIIGYYTKLEPDRIMIKIEDHGIGIPLLEQEQLFTRFFRAKNAINIKGTGLGLNIVKSYLDMLGGTINFTSEENKGTIFVVTIPIHKYKPDYE